MQGQYETEQKQLLEKLHINSIDQLLQLETLSSDRIASRCNLHTLIIDQYLLRLHEIALKTQLLEKKIYNSEVMEQRVIGFGEVCRGFGIGVGVGVQEGELVEVLGRANGGKTMFMLRCIRQAIEKDIRPILLSSSKNCTRQYLEHIDRDKLMIFQFEGIAELAMLIHAIGNQLLIPTAPPQKHLLLIDTLSQIEPQSQPLQFDSSQKFRRLLSIFTTRTQTPLLYSYRINASLFPTQYKKEHHRPKCKNSKEWDGWAGKGIVVDFVGRKRDGRGIGRVVVGKGVECRVYQGVLEDL